MKIPVLTRLCQLRWAGGARQQAEEMTTKRLRDLAVAQCLFRESAPLEIDIRLGAGSLFDFGRRGLAMRVALLL